MGYFARVQIQGEKKECSAQEQPSFLPREQEQMRLLIAESQSSKTLGTCLLVGAAGLGKGLAVKQLSRELRLAGQVVLSGRCDRHRPYAPLIDIVESAFEVLKHHGVAFEDTHMLSCRSGCHERWYAHTNEDQLGQSQEQREMLFYAMAELFRHLSTIKMPVLVFHRMEACDDATLAFLDFLQFQWSTQIRALHLPTSHLPSSHWQESQHANGLFLLGVSSEEVDLKWDKLLVQGSDMNALKAYLASEEVLAKLMTKSAGRLDVIERLFDNEPLTEEEWVLRQMQGKPAFVKKWIQALAVLSGSQRADTVAQLAQVDLHSVLQETQSFHSWLNMEQSEGKTQVAFKDETHRNAVYALMAPDEKRRLHLLVASLTENAEEKVRHAHLGGDIQMALAATQDAMASLKKSYAYEQALALLDSFEKANVELPVVLLEEKVALLALLGSYKQAVTAAQGLYKREPDHHHAFLLARLHQGLGVFAEAQKYYELSLQASHAHRREHLAEYADLMVEFAQTEPAVRLAHEVLSAGRHDGPGLLALTVLGKAEWTQRSYHVAKGHFEEVYAHAPNGSEAKLRSLINIALCHFHVEEIQVAKTKLELAHTLAHQARAIRWEAIALENLAVLAHDGRLYGEAIGAYHRAVNAYKVLKNHVSVVHVAVNFIELYLELGDKERVAALKSFIAMLPKVEQNAFGLESRRHLLEGRLLIAEGKHHNALEALSLALIETEQYPHKKIEVELERIEALLGAEELDQAFDVWNSLTEASMTERERVRWNLHALRLNTHEVNAKDVLEHCLQRPIPLPLKLQAAMELGDIKEARKIEAELEAQVPMGMRVLWRQTPLCKALARFYLEQGACSPSPPIEANIQSRAINTFGFVGDSTAMHKIYRLIPRVAQSDASVLIAGQSGTGKEILAEALHQASSRKQGPLVKVNCAALVETLLLSELFGHEKGAFTGAVQRKKGRFELAEGGTLFLDEIGDISSKTQAALLRVLQEKQFERVGGTQTLSADVRIIAASHKNIERLVKEGVFREDLYYRLRGIVMEMPSLKERDSDVLLIAEHVLGRLAKEHNTSIKSLSPEVREAFMHHDWPGNVRELENVLRSAVVFAENDTIGMQDVHEVFQGTMPLSTESIPTVRLPGERISEINMGGIERSVYSAIKQDRISLFDIKKDIERECIRQAMAESGGNITKAAELLGMKRSRLSQLVSEHGLGAKAGEGKTNEIKAHDAHGIETKERTVV